MLAKASPSRLEPNTPHPPVSKSEEFSPYLTQPENTQLHKLLRNPETATILTRDNILAALKQRHIDGSLPSFQYNALMDILNVHWPHDPVVIAFYRDALATRGDAAIFDLWSPTPGIWDDSLLEPVLQAIEKAADYANFPDKMPRPKEHPWSTIYVALQVLERHSLVWSNNAAIPPRLSKAVLAVCPSLVNRSGLGPKPGESLWSTSAFMLSQTRDPAMVAVLRPFLKEKALEPLGSMERIGIQLRACDQAAIAIKRLLREHYPDDAIVSGSFHKRTPADERAIRNEWEKRVTDLEKRLNARLGK